MNRIPCILSRSANAPPEEYPTCDKWQWTKHLACSGTPPGSTSLCLRVVFWNLCMLNITEFWTMGALFEVSWDSGLLASSACPFERSVGNGVMFIDCCTQICQPKCQTCVLIPVDLGSKKGFHGTFYCYHMLVDVNCFSFHVQLHKKRIMKIWSRFTLTIKSSIHSSSKEGLKTHNN
jgi:hypothetical protein